MKLKQFQDYLKEEQIDFCFLFHPDSSITYFTGINLSQAILIFSRSSAVLYLTKLDRKPRLKGIKVLPWNKDWQDNLSSSKIRRVGINKESCPLLSAEKLKTMFPRAKIIDVSWKLQELRSTKTVEEIKKISKACVITSTAFGNLVQEISNHPQNFITEIDVALFLERYIRKHDAEVAFPTIVASGKNSSTPHHITSAQKLKPGFLQLDLGARYQNYCADMSRVIYLGRPKKEELHFYHLLKETQQAAVDSLTESLSFEVLTKIARDKLGKYSTYFIHSLGHGLGIDVHEAPSFKDKTKVTKDSIFTIEPGIYFPGKFGLRIEDTILFDGKVKILTKADKELIQIKFK